MATTRMISRSLASLALVTLVMGCSASHPKAVVAPSQWTRELPLVQENSDVTFRLDVGAIGHGTGVVISDVGHILTAAHVVEHAQENSLPIAIMIDEGGPGPSTYLADIVAVDHAADLAVIKIARRFVRPATFEDPKNVLPGDPVYLIGYPGNFGEMIERGYVMRVHARFSSKTDETRQHDVTMLDIIDGGGSSGAGVFSAATGKIVGIMQAKYRDDGPADVASLATIRTFLDKNKIPYDKK